MSTADKTFAFASDFEGLAEGGVTPKITVSYDGTQGNPSGAMKVVIASLNAALTETVLHSPATSWDALFTEPDATDLITGLQLISADWRSGTSPPPVWPPDTGFRLTVDVVDSDDASVLSAPLFEMSLSSPPAPWSDLVYGDSVQRAVISGKQVGSTGVKLKLSFTSDVTGGPVPDYQFWIDNIVLRATYSSVADPGGGGSGGDGGGGGDEGGGDDTGGAEDDGTLDWPIEEDIRDCEEPGYYEGPIVHHMMQRAALFANEQRVYVSYGGRCLCYDTVTRSWTDAGYGPLRTVATLAEPNRPETFWFMQDRYVPADERTDPRLPDPPADAIWCAHRALTNNDPWTGWPFARRVQLGPWAVRSMVIRAVRLFVWGSVTDVDLKDSLTDIGRLTLTSDTGYSETYPIRLRWHRESGSQVGMSGTVVDQEFTPAMKGEMLMADLVFTSRCVKVTESMLEYVPQR